MVCFHYVMNLNGFIHINNTGNYPFKLQNSIQITEGFDNRGLDNRGSTLLTYLLCMQFLSFAD